MTPVTLSRCTRQSRHSISTTDEALADKDHGSANGLRRLTPLESRPNTSMEGPPSRPLTTSTSAAPSEVPTHSINSDAEPQRSTFTDSHPELRKLRHEKPPRPLRLSDVAAHNMLPPSSSPNHSAQDSPALSQFSFAKHRKDSLEANLASLQVELELRLGIDRPASQRLRTTATPLSQCSGHSLTPSRSISALEFRGTIGAQSQSHSIRRGPTPGRIQSVLRQAVDRHVQLAERLQREEERFALDQETQRRAAVLACCISESNRRERTVANKQDLLLQAAEHRQKRAEPLTCIMKTIDTTPFSSPSRRWGADAPRTRRSETKDLDPNVEHKRRENERVLYKKLLDAQVEANKVRQQRRKEDDQLLSKSVVETDNAARHHAEEEGRQSKLEVREMLVSAWDLQRQLKRPDPCLCAVE